MFNNWLQKDSNSILSNVYFRTSKNCCTNDTLSSRIYVEFGKQLLTTNSLISKLHVQISKLYMCFVPRTTSQVALFKLVIASLTLQCTLTMNDR
jgi:hypothetical protein